MLPKYPMQLLLKQILIMGYSMMCVTKQNDPHYISLVSQECVPSTNYTTSLTEQADAKSASHFNSPTCIANTRL